MRQYEYTLTFTLPATTDPGRGSRSVQLQETLEIAGSDQGYVRHFQVHPAHSARQTPPPLDARWTCDEESISFSPA